MGPLDPSRAQRGGLRCVVWGRYTRLTNRKIAVSGKATFRAARKRKVAMSHYTQLGITVALICEVCQRDIAWDLRFSGYGRKSFVCDSCFYEITRRYIVCPPL